MPTLKFTIHGVVFEYIGEESELVSFLNKFLSGSIPSSTQMKPILPNATPTIMQKAKEEKMIDIPTPSDEEVINYITSEPSLSHDLFEVQRHFFKRTFMSRGNEKRMYHRTARQLRLIRKQIEKSHGGRFIATKGAKKGLKRYIFKKQEP